MIIIHCVLKNGNKPIDSYTVSHSAVLAITNLQNSNMRKNFHILEAELVEVHRGSRYTSARDLISDFNKHKGLFGAKDLKSLGVL